MTAEFTPTQVRIMEAVIERHKAGKSITIWGMSNITDLPVSQIERAFKKMRAKGMLTSTDGTQYAALRGMDGSALKLRTYRRVAEDGVEVTQCPPMPAWGYGFDDREG